MMSLAAGLPDLITVLVLVRRPGMQSMAAANAFGACLFNGLIALGLPWAVVGSYVDVFPPARGTWYPALVGFVSVGSALIIIGLSGFRLTRGLGAALLLLYLLYLVTILYDGATRFARPPERRMMA